MNDVKCWNCACEFNHTENHAGAAPDVAKRWAYCPRCGAVVEDKRGAERLQAATDGAEGGDPNGKKTDVRPNNVD